MDLPHHNINSFAVANKRFRRSLYKTGKRAVATVGTAAALQGSWSGGRRGNVPPKSDWSAVVYQQLAACLVRPVIKYCWSSSGKKILFTDKYRPKFQIRSHDLQFKIDTYNFLPTFLLYCYTLIMYTYIYLKMLRRICLTLQILKGKLLKCIIDRSLCNRNHLYKHLEKTCICFHTLKAP